MGFRTSDKLQAGNFWHLCLLCILAGMYTYKEKGEISHVVLTWICMGAVKIFCPKSIPIFTEIEMTWNQSQYFDRHLQLQMVKIFQFSFVCVCVFGFLLFSFLLVCLFVLGGLILFCLCCSLFVILFLLLFCVFFSLGYGCLWCGAPFIQTILVWRWFP